jgi:hypothetical protein
MIYLTKRTGNNKQNVYIHDLDSPYVKAVYDKIREADNPFIANTFEDQGKPNSLVEECPDIPYGYHTLTITAWGELDGWWPPQEGEPEYPSEWMDVERIVSGTHNKTDYARLKVPKFH